jgi:hypothetical protein
MDDKNVMLPFEGKCLIFDTGDVCTRLIVCKANVIPKEQQATMPQEKAIPLKLKNPLEEQEAEETEEEKPQKISSQTKPN